MRVLFVLFAFAVAACSGPIAANTPAPTGAPYVKPSPRPVANDPVAISFPRDDAPHDRLTEWWYVTGHLQSADGRRFGYEFVIFRAQRGEFPVTWASHIAVTKYVSPGQTGGFSYDERSEVGAQVDIQVLLDREVTAAFAITGANPLDPSTLNREPWTMLLMPGGAMQLSGNGLDLQLAEGGAPVLHDIDGWVGFAGAGGSYYYSRTRMPTAGTITVDGAPLAVTGSSWFDHQWGDFIAIGDGGWDWFALNLSDGSDLMLSLVRDAAGGYPLVYGTWVTTDGRVRHLDASEINLTSTGTWLSPTTGTLWPSGWSLEIEHLNLAVTITPEVADQELDTRASTGVVYWEGASNVVGTRGRLAITGQAYVELTGYASLR